MTHAPDPLRDEIDAAIAQITRELEIIRFPTNVGGGADNRQAIAGLEAELKELEEARARLRSGP
jgi:hypothetical protein